MKEYPKINSIFKRDVETHKFIMGKWSQPEFEYLRDNEWIFTEKVDGTNIRVQWWNDEISQAVAFAGKSDKASISPPLLLKLQELFPIEKFQFIFPDHSVCLYGEGYGEKIQSGSNYIRNGVDFVLFDILIGHWWLKRSDIEEIASKFEIKTVPIIGRGPIKAAIYFIEDGLLSQWGNFRAEGIVLKPTIDLFARNGERIITKIKYKDFNYMVGGNQ